MKRVLTHRVRVVGAMLGLAFLALPAFSGDFDYLPVEILSQIATAEEAREAWEQRSQEVAAELSIQPYEQQNEFAERRRRAIDRGAGRERRFLEFQLRELGFAEHRVGQESITIRAGRAPSRERPYPLEIRTDLGFLPETDSFEIMYPAPRNAAGRAALDRVVERNALEATITYTLSGTIHGEYSLALTGLQLNSPTDSHVVFTSLPLNRSYVFGPDQPIALGTPSGSFHFEGGQLPETFFLDGDADWFVTDRYAYTGAFSLQSGPISHSSESVLLFSDSVPDGARMTGIRFAVRTSSENRYDSLDFYINGRHVDSWSGDTDWTEVEFATEQRAGESFELMWVYSKDGSVSDGEDAVWIDGIEFMYEGE